jgi:hypothetical protein
VTIAVRDKASLPRTGLDLLITDVTFKLDEGFNLSVPENQLLKLANRVNKKSKVALIAYVSTSSKLSGGRCVRDIRREGENNDEEIRRDEWPRTSEAEFKELGENSSVTDQRIVGRKAPDIPNIAVSGRWALELNVTEVPKG